MYKIKVMNLTIEIENQDDYPFIKKLLESLKGVKIINAEYETVEGLPVHVFEKIEEYGANLKDEDLISKEEFFKYIDVEICRLNSQK